MGGSLGGEAMLQLLGCRGAPMGPELLLFLQRGFKNTLQSVCVCHPLCWDLPAEKLPQKMQVQPCSTAERGFVEVAVECSDLLVAPARPSETLEMLPQQPLNLSSGDKSPPLFACFN